MKRYGHGLYFGQVSVSDLLFPLKEFKYHLRDKNITGNWDRAETFAHKVDWIYYHQDVIHSKLIAAFL